MQSEVIPIRFNESDSSALRELSKRLQINRAEVVRILVRRTLAILQEHDRGQVSAQPAGQQALADKVTER